MIEDREYNKKLVVPKWLTYVESARRHEHSAPNRQVVKLNRKTKDAISKDIKNFDTNPNISDALDLMSGAYVIGDYELAKKMAKVVIKSKSVSGVATRIALSVLGKLDEQNNNFDGRIQIHNLKKYLVGYPRDGIAWIELARLYTLEGLISQAERCVEIACSLYPANRYIVRCAARFFLHIGDVVKAFHYTKRACKLVEDPWIKATNINLAFELGGGLPSRRKMLPGEPQNKEAFFHYSELFETVGMIELESGNENKAKQLFKKAWVVPSLNVLPHGEWVLRKRLPGLKNHFELNIQKSPEALYRDSLSNKKYKIALRALVDWELEEPYSKHPYICASALCSSLENYDKAIEFAERGLVVNPDSFNITNNFVYALLRKGDVLRAEEKFNRLVCPDDGISRIVFDATNGLLEFKKGNVLRGRELYLKSIELAQKNKENNLRFKAILNLLIAELEAGLCDKMLIDKVLSVRLIDEEPDIVLVKRKLEKIYKSPIKKYNNVKNNIRLEDE